ncbi:MAG TPA: MerR family transcriptional regulator [Chitinophagaceae bacterium]|nr:MerR family transcriptional regulator [Chitinophagaceae bacterium]
MDQLDLFSPDQQHAGVPGDDQPKGEQKLPPAAKRGRKPLKESGVNPLLPLNGEKMSLSKQYYSISEVAGLFGVNASLIRFWENEFDVLQPRKNKKGDRLFRQEDVQNLCLIYHLLRVRKFTIEGARKKLKEDGVRTAKNFEMIQSLQRLRDFLVQLRENI